MVACCPANVEPSEAKRYTSAGARGPPSGAAAVWVGAEESPSGAAAVWVGGSVGVLRAQLGGRNSQPLG